MTVCQLFCPRLVNLSDRFVREALSVCLTVLSAFSPVLSYRPFVPPPALRPPPSAPPPSAPLPSALCPSALRCIRRIIHIYDDNAEVYAILPRHRVSACVCLRATIDNRQSSDLPACTSSSCATSLKKCASISTCFPSSFSHAHHHLCPGRPLILPIHCKYRKNTIPGGETE